MTFSPLSIPQIVAMAILAAIVAAWSLYLVRKKGRWLLTVGPIAAAALFGVFTQWPAGDPVPHEEGVPSEASVPSPARAGGEPAGATPLTRKTPFPVDHRDPPPEVRVTGAWTEEERLVLESALVSVLAQTSAASGRRITFHGAGRALPPTRHGVYRHAVTGTWTLATTEGTEPVASGGVPEAAGWGPDPDAARRDAMLRAAAVVAAALSAS